MLTLGFHNVLSSHWTKYASLALFPSSTGIEIPYPDNVMQITGDEALPNGRYITLSSKIRDTQVKRSAGLYSPENDSDQIQILLNYRDPNKSDATYEKELRETSTIEPMRVSIRKFRHSLGQAFEVTMEPLNPAAPSQAPLRHVLILLDKQTMQKKLCLSASCVANPKRAQAFTQEFDRVIAKLRLTE